MISICIPTYNRVELLWQSFEKVINDPRVSEIVIVDDASDLHIWQALIHSEYMKCDKVKFYRNNKNLDCYRNKREAVSKASNEWVILLDSDNVIDSSYLDAFFEMTMYEYGRNQIYQPSFARPHFDFRKYAHMRFNKLNTGNYIHDRWFETMLNACNFFVNRDEYLRIWDGSVDPVTSDSIYFNYRWLEAGNSIYVVPGMEYEHRVHDGSHYQQNVRRTPQGFHQSILNKLKAMK